MASGCSARRAPASASMRTPSTSTACTRHPRPTTPPLARRTAAPAPTVPRTATWACWTPPIPVSAASSRPARTRDCSPLALPPASPPASTDRSVQVNGPFTVLGGPKSTAVPHPDGSHQRLYCVESPERWFEDFGEGQVANGRGQVRLDPDFAALVRGDKYHVFLTEYEDQGGLFVTNVGPHGFDVRAR